jgi:hypothetical protein
VPEQLVINGPYPNPLSPERTATVDLGLPESSSAYAIQCQLFDARGQPIDSRTTSFPAGLQKLNLQLSPSLSSGLYLYQLRIMSTTGSASFSGKIIIP